MPYGDPEGERGRQQLTPRWGGLVLAHIAPPQYLSSARAGQTWPVRLRPAAKRLQLSLPSFAILDSSAGEIGPTD